MFARFPMSFVNVVSHGKGAATEHVFPTDGLGRLYAAAEHGRRTEPDFLLESDPHSRIGSSNIRR
jgi:hypothetical protein